jgi:hypothetical protein
MVHDRDDSTSPCRGLHVPILQQDDDNITPRDRVRITIVTDQGTFLTTPIPLDIKGGQWHT